MHSSIHSGKPSPDKAFTRDIVNGLSQRPKRLPSKYFYDKAGDLLFQEIMALPEYYLTNCEFEIFESQKQKILEQIGAEPFELIELGAGDGTKTKVLLRHFIKEKAEFTYRPLDISSSVLDQLKTSLRNELPDLSIKPLIGDYFQVIKDLKNEEVRVRKVILFLGSNIGNFTPDEAQLFLSALAKNLEPGDMILIGIDLKKNPHIILNAYQDPAGVTARFNKNLLTRINRELEGNFVISDFRHWANYDPVTGATRSFLVSTKPQEVYLKAVNKRFQFEAWEAMYMEISQKYSLQEIKSLAIASGFQPVWHFTDVRKFFADTLWKV